MGALISIFAWAAALFSTLVCGIGSILTSFIPKFYLRWARLWAQTVLFFAGVPLRIEVAHATESTPAAIFMLNHESALDIPSLIMALHGHEIRFLAKRSLF